MSNYDCLGLTYKQQAEYKKKIRERDNYTCQLCGSPGYDVDHILPWHISGDSSEGNLRVLCHPCNLIGRRATLPEGRIKRLPAEEYFANIRAELALVR